MTHHLQHLWLRFRGHAPLWVVLLIGAGLVLRGRQYLFNRSLWLDEAYLAVSFLDRDLGQLVLEPLSNNQAAPLGFLVLVKLVTLFLGTHDWVLRLVPLVSGIFTVLGAWVLARRLLPHRLARAVLVGLIALSPVLVYYSTEFKQYQGDVLATVWLMWLAFRFDPQHAWRDAGKLAVAGAIAIWFSHASLFVLAGAGTVLWIETVLQRNRRAWLAVSAMGLLWLLSFVANHLLTLRSLTANPNLLGFWFFAYAPMPPTTLSEWRWYFEAGLGLVYLAMRHVGVAHHGVMSGWFDGLNVLLALLCALGCLALFRRSPRTAAVGLVTLLAVLVASALHLYPFRSRLILFLVPLVYLALASLVQAVLDSRWLQVRRALASVLSALILLVPAAVSWKVLRHPHNDQNIKGALHHVAENIQPGDGFAIDSMSHKAFDFYTHGVAMGDVPSYVLRPTKNQKHDALATVRRLCSEPTMQRSWVVVTHRLRDRKEYLDHLSAIASPIERWEGSGAVALLYDFRGSEHCRRYHPAAPAGNP
jgi:Dolichyl-phosphate-mannose-protein mannosyltransferase